MSDRLAESTAPPPPGAPPAPRWRRSSRSTGMNNCVEAALLGGALLAVRDSKDVRRPPLRFSAAAWNTFVDGLGPDGAEPRIFT
ncbi:MULTISPECIES: DUF397 domain-containing protein [Streptomyces]|uniref:DUF397 domain-containing protein n=1 Tax=Streptomyces griseus subsp. griseus (strain JCM 4626 / CBS 651.72 / NBRC 13350 / KCC S-0626 / ISP 5235) TaxID=455632 RepID=B1W5F6_STRGG|nr:MULTISPECIES: DUF397 domain-containing protein [Streptomyces]MYR15632.1 DUF397 domain-containing protein [Streptomyces sp. SID724]MYR53944.1 DUF397 domain-containing protein [Streptomyces sp. SID4928]EGE45925.1 protein of unknown function DUF397 [Streptomyces sp. ACT-1]MBW3708861.1 DUF397 domain-containing protein [Streptomyces griseus]SCE62843.1 protein of unknown function [Streptomyces sp. OspMP-M43]